MKKLKEIVQELTAIAKDCPENLQQICFEILLKNALEPSKSGSRDAKANPDEKKDVSDDKKPTPESVVEESGKTQDDLSLTDLHVKAKKFLEKHDLSVDHLNQLFYKEGSQILPLYDDLKTTRTSESQIRIALLQCLLSAIPTGTFSTDVESVRSEASTRKCYDANNWSNNFSNNAALFDFDKYKRTIKTISLSEQGKKELADIVKELQ